MKGKERGDEVAEEESHGGNEIDRDDDSDGNGDRDGDDDDVGDEDEDGREEVIHRNIAKSTYDEVEKEIEVILERPEEPQKENEEDQPLVLVKPPTFPCIFVKPYKEVEVKERSDTKPAMNKINTLAQMRMARATYPALMKNLDAMQQSIQQAVTEMHTFMRLQRESEEVILSKIVVVQTRIEAENKHNLRTI
ncbi:hypothetical protein Scep_018953 [Stephania cephalantha]|uniref:Uncharacterized protein n=1 Tax=Stephania cephalantha TaxID=152367 RepID=A0AAP0I9Z2_9MAGN